MGILGRRRVARGRCPDCGAENVKLVDRCHNIVWRDTDPEFDHAPPRRTWPRRP